MAQSPNAGRQRPNYMRIFIFLAVLTAIEVAVTFTGLPKPTQVPFLIVLAIGKASLVAMFYMHLRYEGIVLRVIAIAPLLFVIILMLLPAFDLVGSR